MRQSFFQWMIMVIIGIMTSSVAFGAEGGLRAVPTGNKVFLVNHEGENEISNFCYTIQGQNYIRLRDVASLMGFKVEWNEKEKEIQISMNEKVGPPLLREGIRREEINPLPIEQRVRIDGESKELSGYLIDGFAYFAVRDMAILLDYSCQWDDKSKAVTLQKNASDESQLPKVPQNMDEILKMYLGRTSGEGIIATNNITYIHGSKDYGSLEKYIQENFDSNFQIRDYIIEENPPVGTTTVDISNKEGGGNATLPFNTLEIRLQVKGYIAFYGYRVKVFSGYVKYIEPVGEWNEDFDLSKVEVLEFTDEELKDMAVKKMGLKETMR